MRVRALAFLIMVPLAAACGQRGDAGGSKAPALTVRAHRVEARPQTGYERVPGTVRPKLRAGIEAKISGRIERMNVREGESVKAGQLLAVLDLREIQAKLDQAQTAAEQAERDLKRYALLLRQKATTQAEYENVDAKARIARSAAAEAQTMLDYAKITAPFEGVVTRKLVDVGDLATPGRTILELEDPSALRFEANVPETLIGGLKMDLSCEIRISQLDKALSGRVAEIATTVDESSRSYLVKFDLPVAEALRSGQYGHATVPAHEEILLQAPVTTVVKRGQLELVFVIEQGQARLRIVRSGRVNGGQIEILAGVSAGEELVDGDVSQLRDGQRVEVRS